MTEHNLPAVQKANSIRALFEKETVRKQIAMAIPKHLSVDRLLRVAMTSIRTNRKLLDCSQESLLAAVMGCAQLGLEPEPFLGQAYLVPYWNEKKKALEAQLIPGYRGYITLARRSGEVKSVTAQVVYENDKFEMEYGLEEILKHIPNDGDRGKPKGAYVIFRYKDGSHSFDYMSVADINKIMERSKSKDREGNLVGPWVTDWPEMAKKTVIRRHIKLVPLSIEMATAAAAEEKAFAGESQAGLFLDTQEAEYTEVDGNGEPDPAAIAEFERLVKEKGADPNSEAMAKCIQEIARVNNQTAEGVKAQASTPENFPKFWVFWQRHTSPDKKKGRPAGSGKKAPETASTETSPETDTKTHPEPEKDKGPAQGIGAVGSQLCSHEPPPWIGAEQYKELAKAPAEILAAAYQEAGIAPTLKLSELDHDSAEALLGFVRSK
jgi:recombination protein RecT